MTDTKESENIHSTSPNRLMNAASDTQALFCPASTLCAEGRFAVEIATSPRGRAQAVIRETASRRRLAHTAWFATPIEALVAGRALGDILDNANPQPHDAADAPARPDFSFADDRRSLQVA